MGIRIQEGMFSGAGCIASVMFGDDQFRLPFVVTPHSVGDSGSHWLIEVVISRF